MPLENQKSLLPSPSSPILFLSFPFHFHWCSWSTHQTDTRFYTRDWHQGFPGWPYPLLSLSRSPIMLHSSSWVIPGIACRPSNGSSTAFFPHQRSGVSNLIVYRAFSYVSEGAKIIAKGVMGYSRLSVQIHKMIISSERRLYEA